MTDILARLPQDSLLAAFAGAQVLVACFSLLIAQAYRERALALHALSVGLGLLVLYALVLPLPRNLNHWVPEAAMLVLLGVACLLLRELVNHAGAMRRLRQVLLGMAIALPLAALAGVMGRWSLLLAGAAAFGALMLLVMLRAWPQSQPWAWWLGAALLALLLAAVNLGADAWGLADAAPVPLAAALTLWGAGTYLATVWRSRIFGETRVRVDARKVLDPLTGLSTPLIFADRIDAARAILRRYGHPSVVLLVEIENLQALVRELGPEAAEPSVQTAASRIRQALGEADVAARISHRRIAVLAEGVSLAEGASKVGTRILVAGLKEPLPHAPAEFLQLRMVVAAVPREGLGAKALLHRLGVLLDEQLRAPSDRRIVSVSAETLLA